ncbi:DNA topoisomerase III [Novisyntrophococcus fermenticellae]|uniref:DNA topoisomerase III n=1 Tax=Novisyntrophococcus fermenticellae TaxID=2068655 RepID=UPI001E34DC0A|nr:DNA topoisomerase III [Novisyntrophococcus fermenticellae]
MKTLVIAEKPSVGRDIARVLNCRQNGNGCIEGSQYVVTWALGHLVTLLDPEDYDKKYKEWKLEVLPLMPAKLKIKVIPQTGKQYHAIQMLLDRKDISQVVIATDAGREGELVARWILDKAHNQKPCKRLWISSVTDKAIKEGFAHLKDSREYDTLYHAAVSRAESDWLVGINCTRALTCKYNAQLSCGRVQTPTLAMIDKREHEIRAFEPKPYYTISTLAGGVSYLWKDGKTGETRIFSKERSQEIQSRITHKEFKLTKVEKKDKKTYAPLLYDLTELQRDANKRFGYSAKQTLNIMQRLYEFHKVLTYPRTDSRYLTADIVPTLRERLEAIAVGPYKTFAAKAKQMKLSGKLPFVNDSKVSDHHAIIPTEQFVQLNAMSVEERRIYDLVVRRFISVLYPPCIYEETTLTGLSGGETFTAKGKRIVENGWREIYESGQNPDEEDEAHEDMKEQTLPLLQQGQIFFDSKVTIREGKTKPPARFTEATLLSAMENPIRYMESSDIRMAKTLGETGGLGTVATRADIIEKLFNSFLLEKKGNEILLTGKAKQLLKLVPADLKKPELTASWEMKLSDIAKGKLAHQDFMSEIRTYTGDLIHEIKSEEGTFRHDNLTNKKCPQCGKRLLSVNGKNAKLLVCQDRACGYRETISRTTNARCPVCHKRMEMYGKGEEATFICSCGHKERLDKFEERRRKEGGGVTKKDVAKYMANQKKEAAKPLNNAFADALKGMKLN